MTHLQRVSRIAIVIAALVGVRGAIAEPQPPARIIRIADFTSQLQPPPFQATFALPKWQNGRLIWREAANRIIVIEAAGKVACDSAVTAPGIERLELSDFAVGGNGRIAISGGGAGDSGAVTFVAWLDRAGSFQRMTSTGSFVANQIAFAPDGSLWAFGRERNSTSYDALRHYDADGKQISSAFPMTQPRPPSPGSTGATFLSVGPNGALGIFGGPTQEWIEMNPTGEIVGRFPLPQLARPGVSEFLGVAITADGEVYAGANQHVENENAPLLFKLARSKKQWEVLPSEAFALWLGTEGSQLVLAGQ